MAHDIFSSRFYGNRKAAWHGLGIVNDEAQTAADTLKLIGRYEIVLDPLIRAYDNQPSGQNTILRLPTDDDPQVQQFGIVADGYEVLTPQDVAEMWDGRVKLPIETMAALKLGKVFLITSKLSSLDVRGDEIARYLIVSSTMDGKTAFWGGETDVRVVCANTLALAKAHPRSSFRIPHFKGAKEMMGDWLQTVREVAEFKTDVIQEAYNLLAATKASESDVAKMAKDIYKMPRQPDDTKQTKRSYEERMEIFEREVAWTKRARSTTVELFKGASPAGMPDNLMSTAWAAWNAFTEFETYRRGTYEATAINLLNGDRAANINRAYELCLELA